MDKAKRRLYTESLGTAVLFVAYFRLLDYVRPPAYLSVSLRIVGWALILLATYLISTKWRAYKRLQVTEELTK